MFCFYSVCLWTSREKTTDKREDEQNKQNSVPTEYIKNINILQLLHLNLGIGKIPELISSVRPTHVIKIRKNSHWIFGSHTRKKLKCRIQKYVCNLNWRKIKWRRKNLEYSWEKKESRGEDTPWETKLFVFHYYLSLFNNCLTLMIDIRMGLETENNKNTTITTSTFSLVLFTYARSKWAHTGRIWYILYTLEFNSIEFVSSVDHFLKNLFKPIRITIEHARYRLIFDACSLHYIRLSCLVIH